MTDEHDVQQPIEQFVRTHFSVADGDNRFTPTVDLFESGYIDSVGLIELLGFIESTFGVTVPDDDLMSDDFATLEGIGTIVGRLRDGQG